MSSANEHLPPPPKPRMSPLDFRNTDLVSRLLAATPPYLYNMSLLPNTYFFSEMLRSFVQAKNEHNNRNVSGSMHHPSRRSRKRTWSTARAECFQKNTVSPKPPPPEKQEVQADWMLKSNNNNKSCETPLELTINKIDESDNKIPQISFPNKLENFNQTKLDIPNIQEQMFPMMHPSVSNQDNATSNLVLPPPPPMWYPPLYPTPPYGIDPLHFFIDLRVSGHIYDRKNQKETASSPPSTFVAPLPRDKVRSEPEEIKIEEPKFPNRDIFQSRHASAFSVPIPSANKNTPINLSHLNAYDKQEHKPTKFDVKSMGFDKNTNKTSINYVMGNIENIYKGIHSTKEIENENLEMKYQQQQRRTSDENAEDVTETEEEKEKRLKDLRALFGLELVVDYMGNDKPGQSQTSQNMLESVPSTDTESPINSPALEVVALHDET